MGYIKKGLFLILFLFLTLSFIKNAFEFWKNQNFYASYKIEYEEAKKTNTQLKTEKLRKSDLNEIEKTIRNKLNLMKENEIAIIIPVPSPSPTIIPTPTPLIYQQWVHLFGGF